MRIGDILELRVKDVKGKNCIYVVEAKTRHRRKNKRNRYTVPQTIAKELLDYIDAEELADEDYLFPSPNRYCLHLSRRQAYNIINSAAKQAGVTAAIGCHTLRKTFGYWHYKQFKDVAMLQKIFNHVTPEETLLYIGVTDEQISNTLNNFSI
jgi:integrase